MRARSSVLVGAFSLLIVGSFGGPVGAQTSAQAPGDRAWTIVRSGIASEKIQQRTASVRVLGLLEKDKAAMELALHALGDESPDVRAAAADALGQMKARAAIPQLVNAMRTETEVAVVMASARAVIALGEPLGYGVYYAVLTGERKTGEGLLDQQKKMLKDPKKMAEFGFEQGIGFIPFAGMGYGVIRAIAKDDASPVRAAAAKVLARDPDPKTREALVDATSDKSWLVRTAALDALSQRGDPRGIARIAPRLDDDEDVVRYTAAAATIHLRDVERSRAR